MRRDVLDAIGVALVERAELIRDETVSGQARSCLAKATKVVALADELLTLARAAALLSAKRAT